MITLNTWCMDDCTLGRLSFGNFHCFTLELPWKNNENNISCVPAGIYRYHRYLSPSKGKVLLLEDVPDRTYVEIHAGNFTRDILGCILVGDSIKYLDRDKIPDVTNSKATLRNLLSMLPLEQGYINILRTGDYDDANHAM